MAEPDQRAPTSSYRGPDRRGVARFSIPTRLPTAILLVAAVGFVVVGARYELGIGPRAEAAIGTMAGTLGLVAGIASLLRWRLDGIARGWWCGWGLLAMGAAALAVDPGAGTHPAPIEFAGLSLGALCFARAVVGPEVDTSVRVHSTLLMMLGGTVVIAPIAALSSRSSMLDTQWGMVGVGATWLALAIIAAVQVHRTHHDAESTWIVPVSVALGLGALMPSVVSGPAASSVAANWFGLAAMLLAGVGALGGLVRAAVHHRTRALREHIEHERELANRRRVEENFADRLHEMRSTVVAIEGGVSTLGPLGSTDRAADADREATLRAALIAEIRRLRVLVNEAPTPANVAPFDVAAALESTVALHRANGENVTLEASGNPRALGRPGEIAQVLHGLLANAAKYAPGAPVRVVVRPELDEIAIRVEDDGPGIEPEYWDAIFERGVRINSDGPAEGTGLGLAVAQRIVRSQDGDLWVETGPSAGATFVISIPAAPALRVVDNRAEEPIMVPSQIERAQ